MDIIVMDHIIIIAADYYQYANYRRWHLPSYLIISGRPIEDRAGYHQKENHVIIMIQRIQCNLYEYDTTDNLFQTASDTLTALQKKVHAREHTFEKTL